MTTEIFKNPWSREREGNTGAAVAEVSARSSSRANRFRLRSAGLQSLRDQAVHLRRVRQQPVQSAILRVRLRNEIINFEIETILRKRMRNIIRIVGTDKLETKILTVIAFRLGLVEKIFLEIYRVHLAGSRNVRNCDPKFSFSRQAKEILNKWRYQYLRRNLEFRLFMVCRVKKSQ